MRREVVKTEQQGAFSQVEFRVSAGSTCQVRSSWVFGRRRFRLSVLFSGQGLSLAVEFRPLAQVLLVWSVFFFGKGSGEFESGFCNWLSSFQACCRLAKVLIRQSPFRWQYPLSVKSGL